MQPLTVNLSLARDDTGHLLLADSNGKKTVRTGSQYDHLACTLMIKRDARDVGAELLLYFDESGVQLGTENSFSLPAVLTQNQSVRLEAAYRREDGELEHSNIITLKFRESLVADGTTEIVDVARLTEFLDCINGEVIS